MITHDLLVVIARYLACTLCSLNWLILYFSFLQWFCFVWQQFCFPWAFLSMKLVVLHCRWDLNKNINRPSTYAFRHLLAKVHSFLSETVRANQPAEINKHSVYFTRLPIYHFATLVMFLGKPTLDYLRAFEIIYLLSFFLHYVFLSNNLAKIQGQIQV